MSNKPNTRRREPKPPKRDTRLVFGLCTWWGSIYDASTAHSVPTCPFCSSPLTEADESVEWFLAHLKPYPGESDEFTREFVEWCRHPRPCSRTRDAAMARFRAERSDNTNGAEAE